MFNRGAEYFKKMNKEKTLVLIDFQADWCGPCITMEPILEEISKKYSQQLQFLKVDADKNKKLVENFRIRSIPTLILFKTGKEVWRKSGLISTRDLEEVIQQYL